MSSSELSRRAFLGSVGSGVAMAAAARAPRAGKSANDQVVIGLVGVGNQGTSRLREFMAEADVRIGAICDVDQRHLERAVGLVEKDKGQKPQGFADFRRLLEVKEI